MPYSNEALVERFVNGETSGKANNMDIRSGPIKRDGWLIADDDSTALVGYGWAVYAVNTGRRVILFNGWREWAREKPGHSGHTTLQHMNLVSRKAGPTALTDHRAPQCADAPDSAHTMRPDRKLPSLG